MTTTEVGGGRIEVDRLTKRFGDLTAVDDLTFTVEPGRITGFLGPNGAGKTTTLRMLLGLVRPTSGTATIGGRRYHDIPSPLAAVGSALEATNFHPGRTGRDHLKVLADSTHIDHRRVDEMLEQVGLADAARKRAGGYSMGMRQRLGLAAAMLGDPQVLILDEPANGLDPEGIRWMREFLRALASQGRTVFVSSHLLSEMELLADDIVIIANGKLVRQGTVGEVVTSMTTTAHVRVRTPQADTLSAALSGVPGVTVTPGTDNTLLIAGAEAPAIGKAALAAGVELHELTPERPDLEGVFLELTAGKAGIR